MFRLAIAVFLGLSLFYLFPLLAVVVALMLNS